jgi:hypothetical protein
MDKRTEKTGEIVLYQPEGAVKLEVRVENETVWLTQAQMAELFGVKEHTITYHIQEVFSTDELEQIPTTRKIRVVRAEGKRTVSRNIDFYNLDMIISIGYRVNSKAGVRFRRWANQVLKDHLLKGYSINPRMMTVGMQVESRFREHDAKISLVEGAVQSQESRLSAVEQRIDFFVQAAQTPTGGILATGTRFDGFVLIGDLVKSAKRSVVFIDPFATVEVLKFAAMRAKGVSAVIYSARITPEFKAAKDLHNKQYPGLDLKTMRTIHDRFLLVDDTVYHFGASFKDMGNEMTAYSILNFVTPEEVIAKVVESTKGRHKQS